VQIDWSDERCIVCLRTPRDADPTTVRTVAHVIPQSLGGELSASFLCKRCNSEMGRMEALLARDISVRRLVKYQLQDRLPEKLAKAILSGEEFFVDHPDYGRITAVVDEDGFLRPRQSKTLKDDKHTLAQALAELEGRDAPEERKAGLSDAFEQATPGEWIDVRPGYRIQRAIDWTQISLKESLNDPVVGHEVPLGIAYLYVALCLRERVYDPALQPVRDALYRAIEGDPSEARVLMPLAKRMGTDIVDPVHVLRAKDKDGGVQVTVQIFRDLAWPVDFPGIKLGGEQTLYVIDLEQGRELWCSKLSSR
jgi:HNH endonuclease